MNLLRDEELVPLIGKDAQPARGVGLHVAVTARSVAEFKGTLGPGRHCAADFIPRCEAIQPDAVFFYAEVLHLALRTIQTMFRELSPPGRFSFGLSRLSFLFGLRFPGRDHSLIVPPSLLCSLSPRAACPLFHLLHLASSIVPLAPLFSS